MRRVASIDIGLKRIGVAIAIGDVVVPQDAIVRKNRDQASSEVDRFLQEFKIETLIVGVPFGGSSEGEMIRRVRHFVSLLKFDREIFFQDESFSSFEAKKELTNLNIKQKRDGRVDSISAKLTLQRWLDRAKE